MIWWRFRSSWWSRLRRGREPASLPAAQPELAGWQSAQPGAAPQGSQLNRPRVAWKR